MPRFLVTRGLGGSASALLSMGFIEHVRAVFKGGRRFVKKAYGEIEDRLKISVMLLSVNGKELVKPIINKVTKVFSDKDEISLEVLPKKLIARKSDEIKVDAKIISGDDNEHN